MSAVRTFNNMEYGQLNNSNQTVLNPKFTMQKGPNKLDKKPMPEPTFLDRVYIKEEIKKREQSVRVQVQYDKLKLEDEE